MRSSLLSPLLFALLSAGVAGSDERAGEITQKAPTYPLLVREGFAARAGFETVPASTVPRSSKASGSDGDMLVTTHALDPDVDAYQVRGGGLDHLRSITLVWPLEASDSPFMFDLYLHGDLEDADGLAFQIRGLDVRKFLHQSIAHLDGAADVARLQSYFAEFSRKSKILYPLEPLACQPRCETAYEVRAVEIIGERLRALASSYGEGSPEREGLQRANRWLGFDPVGGLTIVHRNLSEVATEISRGPDTTDQRLRLEAVARVHALTSKVLELSAAHKISDLVLTNNCREPGNFEIGLRDGLGRPVLKGAFLLPPEKYDHLLRQYSGLGIADQGTGVRVSETLRAFDQSAGEESGERHSWDRVIPRVSIGDLEVLTVSSAQAWKTCNGAIQVKTGMISYHDYELEVRRKSAAVSGTYHPLSFVRVNPGVSPPAGFRAPNGQSAETYWFEPENAGKAVPHRFLTFEDVQSYDVHLSGFEVNGVYIGRTDLDHFDPERQEGRWPFDYGYLRDLRRFEVHGVADGVVEIRLLGRKGDGVHFVLGNVALAVGEEVELQFGVGTQPLLAPYNNDVFQEPLTYNLAYRSDGLILDHHAPEIGVEQVYLQRLSDAGHGTGHAYRIRLVSHERILPVWEGTIYAVGPGCELLV